MRIDKTKALISMARLDLNQKELADGIGMSRGNLSTLLNGKSCSPKSIYKVAEALKVDVTEILED